MKRAGDVRYVVLAGMPGSGKSAVGSRLAARLQASFSDLDDVIEDATGRTIPDIFDSDGETAFRELECKTLEDILGRPTRQVVAGGGGVVTTGCGMRLLCRPDVACAWLTASMPVLRARLDADGTVRPLLAEPGALERLARERRHSYLLAADTVLDTDHLDPDASAEILAARLHPYLADA